MYQSKSATGGGYCTLLRKIGKENWPPGISDWLRFYVYVCGTACEYCICLVLACVCVCGYIHECMLCDCICIQRLEEDINCPAQSLATLFP